MPLAPRHGSEVRHIAGDPFDETLVGPSSAAWGRGPSEHSRVAYVTTDGGTTAPPDGITRQAARYCASSWITPVSHEPALASTFASINRHLHVKTLSISR